MTDHENRADTLADVVTNAVGQWLATNGGGMLTGMNLIVNYVDEDGLPGWSSAHFEGQSLAITMGMADFLQLRIKVAAEDYIRRTERDD